MRVACVNVVRGEFQLEVVEPSRSRLRRVYALGKAEPSERHPPQGPLQRLVSRLLRRGFRRLDVTLADTATGVAAVHGSACGLAISEDERWIVTVSPTGRAPWMAVGGPGGHPRLVAVSLDPVSGRLYLVLEHLHDDGIRLRQVKTANLADVLARKECRPSSAVSSPRGGHHAQPNAKP